MFKFETMNDNHIEAAARLALLEYQEERRSVPILPDGGYYDLFCEMISGMTGHGLGIVALDGSDPAGFFTCYIPRDRHFGLTQGTFSPVHAHAAVRHERRRLYSLLYQEAAKKWVGQGILSHAIALYSHDNDAINSFFWNGFGLRTVDALRKVEAIPAEKVHNITFSELPAGEVDPVVPLKQGLIRHLNGSPLFMPHNPDISAEEIRTEQAEENQRYFIAMDGAKSVAFIEIKGSGENFACDYSGMMNICGAYLLPEYRGRGIYQAFLSYLMEVLLKEGYTLCGVDFEGFNPTASGFWLKYFTAYTYGVVRRIDERIYQAK